MYKGFLALAIVFLAVALIVPVYALYDTLTTNINQVRTNLPDLQDQQNADQFFSNLSGNQQDLLLILVVFEAIFVSLFAGTLWYALKCRARDSCRTFPAPG